ncbi:PH domain-containing protein [Arcanobacterium canis]|uniref:PH domain-containing protein n=1 Tax=Arcanobacterium canis TaxID=999183 RepID=A0ABY8FX81_9ACTO|nr:PH domain-containing protein [Arcanobacterium canis]WFM83125.1 PH domain-containing protein [Arcanobacterium canis]
MRTELTSVQFTPVDPRYAKVVNIYILIVALCLIVPPMAYAVLATFFWGTIAMWIGWGIVALACVLTVWCAWIMRRQVGAFGYAEGDTELLVRRGVMFKRVVVVPFGRMQQVDVSAGPILGHYGLSSLELVTASATTNATIHGVSKEEADRLRLKLTQLGNAMAEGL